MKLVTKFELATKTTYQLQGLYKEIFNELAKSNPSSPQRKNALASLQNIENELSSRAFSP